MQKQTFISFYIATFLATYDAINHDMNCMAGKGAENYNQPIEDAALLAVEAWKKVESLTVEVPSAPVVESPAKLA